MKKIISIILLLSMLVGILASCSGGDNEVEVERIYFDEEEITISVGERITLEPLIYPKSARDAELEWESSNEDVATVSRGKVKGISEGTAVISVEAENGKCATCRVTVISGVDDPDGPDVSEDEDVPVGNKVGNKCYTYDLNLLDGSGTVNIKSFLGKIVVINFWGTWCGPCKQELPDFNRIASDYAEDVVILTIHSYFSSNGALNYVNSNFLGSNMIFAIDSPLTEAMDMYYNLLGGKGSYPYSLVLDRRGVINYVKTGTMEYDQLAEIIDGIKGTEDDDNNQGNTNTGEGGGNANVLDLANGAYDGSEVTIEFWHTMGMSNRAILEDAIARFNEIYPNIKVEHMSYGDYDEIYNQVRVKLTIGRQPNLVFCYPDHVATYNKANAVITFDELMANQSVVSSSGEMMGLTQAQLDDFIDGFLSEGREYGDGKMYSLPFQKSTEVLYYNKTVFDQNGIPAPETWDDVEAAIKVLKEIYPRSTPLGYDSEENFFITLAAQNGNDYTSATGEHYTFVNDGNKAFVAKFAEWYQKGWMTTSSLTAGYYMSDLFTPSDNNSYGKVFMYVGSSAGAKYSLPDKIGSDYPFEVGVVPVPQVDINNPKVISQGPSLCMFEDTNPQEVYASWLFIKFLTTDVQFQVQYSMNSGYVPVIESAAENAAYQAFLSKADGGDFITSLVAKVALEQQDYYFSTPAFVGSADARTNVGLLVQSVFEKYTLGADNKAMIDEQFKKYYDYCNY